MAFIILRLKQNAEEPYAIYDLEKFGKWPIRKKQLVVGNVSNNKSDITLLSNAKKKSFGKIIKTSSGWQYKFIKGTKIIEGIFSHGIKIPLFENIIEFKEEL